MTLTMDTANYVAKLEELAKRKGWELKYEDVHSERSDHIERFTVRVIMNDQPYANGVGKNESEAKQMAAKNAQELLDPPPETKEDPPSSVPPTVQPTTDIIQHNYIRWLKEYEQKQGISIKAIESTITKIQCCSFVVDDKEYPKAYGETKEAAKEEAAKLVYHEIRTCKTTETGDGMLNQPVEGVCQGISEITTSSQSLSITAEDEGFTDVDFIEALSHYCENNNLVPEYFPQKRTGSSHDSQCFYKVVINEKHYPLAKGKNDEEAKQKAAQLALAALQEQLSCSWDSNGLMPDSEITNDVSPVEKTLTQSVASRFLAEFDPIDCLGKGAYGNVFKAKKKFPEKYFAIKIIPFKEKALREVTALSDLSHMNIVRYYDCWFEDTGYQWDSTVDSCSSSESTGSNAPEKFLYIQMELCNTETLRHWIDEKNAHTVRKSQRSRMKSLEIAQQLITGLQYIHSESFIHRDLKPANILFGRNDVVKIGDFGLVTAEGNDAESLIERTVCKGTPSYMAPEQKNRKTYDRKVDIFAFGLIYFELLWKIKTQHERQEIWDKLRAQELPDDFTHHFLEEGLLIKSMLSDQPQGRPEATEVKQKLEKCDQLLKMKKNMRTV